MEATDKPLLVDAGLKDRREDAEQDVDMVEAQNEGEEEEEREMEDEAEVRDGNFGATDIVEDEDQGNGENEEEGPTQAWNTAQENFTDFQFIRDGGQDSGTALTTEVVEAKLSGLWNDGYKVLTAKVNKDRRFVCVDYPGIVQNVDKALETMEGRCAISKTLSANGRLAIYFRPSDPYCKPVFANCTFSQNLLVKVRRRKKKRQSGNPHVSSEVGCSKSSTSEEVESEDPYEYQLVVEGIVDRMYSFDTMCDFQYLPVVKTEPSQNASDSQPTQPYQEILSQIVPDFDDTRQDYLERPMKLFLPPLVFSKRQIPVSFMFDNDQPTAVKSDLIETERKKRVLGTIHLTFDHPNIPTEPHPDGNLSLEKLPKNYREEGVITLKKLFELRPIWSKAGLQVNIQPEYRRYLTYLLPMVAYYITNGAWKNLWVKFGYNPRTEPGAKIFQTIDFRIRKLVNRSSIDGKRELMTKGLLKCSDETPSSEKSSGVEFATNLNATYHARRAKDAKDLAYVFRMDRMPPYRQMRYQVCDIQHPLIQAKLHENDGQEKTCTERDGWCIPDFTDLCREILHKEVMELQAKQKNVEGGGKQPQKSKAKQMACEGE